MVGYELFETGMKLIAPKKGRYFAGKRPTLEEIANCPLIVFSLSGSIDPFLEKRFTEEKLSPNIIMTHNNFASVKKYVAKGMGVALLSGYAVSEEDRKNIDVFSMDHSLFKKKIWNNIKETKIYLPRCKSFHSNDQS